MKKILSQIIAVEKQVKNEATKTLTELHRLSSSSGAFTGMVRTYEPKDDEGERLPPESVKVQLKAETNLELAAQCWGAWLDVVLDKDVGNQRAVGNIKIDGKMLLSGVPVSTLLFLEKRLQDVATFVNELPLRDPAYDWTLDVGDGLWKTEPTQKIRTKKTAEALVLLPQTEHQPGQAKEITVDRPVGHWIETRLSGALSPARKRELQQRVSTLLKAVKEAREEANRQEVETEKLAKNIFAYLLAGTFPA